MEKQRIEYIDYLKGFAILLVVIGHFITPNFTIGGSKAEYQIFDFIYSFHMPLFMFLGGYTAYYSFSKPRVSSIKYLLKRTLCLLIPYFLWSLVIDNFLRGNFSFDISSIKSTLNMLIVDYTGLWFLPTIWFLSVLLVCHEHIQKKIWKSDNIYKSMFISLVLLCFLLISYKLISIKFIQSVISYFIPFFIGVMILKYDVVKNIFKNMTIITIASFVFLICALNFTNDGGVFVDKIMRLIAGITSLPVFFYLFKNSNLPNFIKSQLSFWGKNTLVIYIVSGGMTTFGVSKLDNFSPFWMFMITLLASIIICNVCSFISRIIALIPLLDFVIFGRNKMKYQKTADSTLKIE